MVERSLPQTITVDINDPTHPCFDCQNRQRRDSTGVVNADNICLDGHDATFDCPYKMTIAYEPRVAPEKP